MDPVTDLIFVLVREIVVPFLLPILLIASLVVMAGGRPGPVFHRSYFLLVSLTKAAVRLFIEVVQLLLSTRKSGPSRRYPPPKRW